MQAFLDLAIVIRELDFAVFWLLQPPLCWKVPENCNRGKMGWLGWEVAQGVYIERAALVASCLLLELVLVSLLPLDNLNLSEAS